MKVLFIGLGSIGQRHLRILKNLHKKKIDIYYLSNSNSNLVIDDNLKAKKVKSLSKYYNIKKIKLSEIRAGFIDLTFITNPPFLHINYALKMAKLKSNLFIEKPLSDNLKGIKLLINISKKNKIKIYSGYHLRFHPGIIKLKKLIVSKVLGKVISGLFYFGEYLPMTRTFVNYSKTHMAKKKFGGGATLSLSHQIDLCVHLLENLRLTYSSISKKSNLNINADDSCKIIFKDNRNSSFFLIQNFLDNPADIFIKLNFEKGFSEWNYHQKTLIIYENGKKIKKFFFKKLERNHIFKKQIKFILHDLKEPYKLNRSFYESVDCLKIIKKAKKINTK